MNQTSERYNVLIGNVQGEAYTHTRRKKNIRFQLNFKRRRSHGMYGNMIGMGIGGRGNR